MKPALSGVIAAAVLASAVTGGVLRPDLVRIAAAEGGGAPIYYQDPDGRPSYSPTPKKTPDDRDYRGVPPSADVTFDEEPAAEKTAAAPTDRKIKYYRHPMGLPDTSPLPRKDSMGMDYIAVYEGEDSDD